MCQPDIPNFHSGDAIGAAPCCWLNLLLEILRLDADHAYSPARCSVLSQEVVVVEAMVPAEGLVLVEVAARFTRVVHAM